MKCIFGISKRPVNFPSGATQQSCLFRGHLYLVLSAPRGRVYWFLFHELGETKHGEDIPRFPKEDELLLAAHYRSDKITETVTFGELYDNRIKSTLVPLEEHVFRRWHFQRILIIGDAATKVLHISSQHIRFPFKVLTTRSRSTQLPHRAEMAQLRRQQTWSTP